MASPFEILGIEADADDEEVVQAYRRRVKEAHPDHGGSAREFQRVKTAYEQIQAGDGNEPATPERSDECFRQGERVRRGEELRQEPTRVEYLNYEALDEHGWGLADDDLFEKASAAGLDPVDYGRFLVEPHESLLEAAENRGFAWPFACRGGACANCAIAVMHGELSMPVDHILSPAMMERGIRLSCNGMPTTDEMQVVYNVKRLPGLDELRLPPHPFRQAHSDD